MASSLSQTRTGGGKHGPCFPPPVRVCDRLDAMTFHVERIDHVVLRVRDLAAMVRFYEQALGFNVERTLERLSLVQMRAGASLLDLIAAERPDGAGNMDHLCF